MSQEEPFIDAWTEGEQRGEASTAASVSVTDVIAADKATTEAAWPEVPWRVKHVGDEGNKSWHVVDAFGLFICSLEDEVEARFIAASRSRLAVYIAAIEAVVRLCDADAVTRYPYADDAMPGDKVVLVEDVRRALAVLAPSTEEPK